MDISKLDEANRLVKLLKDRESFIEKCNNGDPESFFMRCNDMELSISEKMQVYSLIKDSIEKIHNQLEEL